MSCPGNSFPRYSLPPFQHLPAGPKPHFVEHFRRVGVPPVINLIAAGAFRNDSGSIQATEYPVLENREIVIQTPIYIPAVQTLIYRDPIPTPAIPASAPVNPAMVAPAKRSMSQAGLKRPASPSDTPPSHPPLSDLADLADLAQVASEKENLPQSPEQPKHDAPTPPLKRARPAAPDSVLAPHAKPHPVHITFHPVPVPGSRVFEAPKPAPKPAPQPAPKPAPQPAAAVQPPSLIYVRHEQPCSFHADFSRHPVFAMIADMNKSIEKGPFPSPLFQKVMDANMAFSIRSLSPQESAAWQQTRDAWLSKALAAYSTSEQLEEKLSALVQMEAQLPPQAPNCFRIKELDLTGFAPRCDFLETLTKLRSLEKISLGRLIWVKDAATLSQLPALQHLIIKSCDLSSQEWAKFPKLPALKSLSMGECSKLEGKHLHYLPSHIEILELQDPGYINGQSLSDLSNHFVQLQHLKIEAASIGPNADLTQLRKLIHLRSLVLKTRLHSAFGLKREQVFKLFQQGAFPHLATLELGRALDEIPIRALSYSLPSIKTINIQNNNNLNQNDVPKTHDPDSTETEAG